VVGTSVPDQTRYRLQEAFCALLAAVAWEAPRGLLLCLDDLHWADPSSLRLLAHLGRKLDDVPILIAATYRSTDVDPSHLPTEVVAGLFRHRRCLQLDLPAFTPHEVAVAVAGMHGDAVAPAVIDALRRLTAGNPFFLEELVRRLHDDGHDLADSGVAEMDWELPQSLRHVIAARLARLTRDARRLLRTLSVLGDGAAPAVLAKAAELPDGLFLDTLDE
jgi:predicted ATPase